nr:putative retrotransposon Ty1-copia subclass protein [Tanacetum cinerariifolium]
MTDYFKIKCSRIKKKSSLNIPNKENSSPSSHLRGEYHICMYIDAEEHELGDLGEPANYKAALLDPESEKWLNAMNVVMKSMKDNEVWVLVELPPNGKTVGSKWLFKKKTDMDGVVHTYNARLVAKGYTQTSGIDYEETFSPFADIRAIRILIAIAASTEIEAEYIDAFNSSKEAVWVRKFISGLGVVPIIEEPISIYCDNTRAIAIANESGITKGARHFHAKIHYLREVIKYGDIKLEKVHTDDNLADPFTKAPNFPKLEGRRWGRSIPQNQGDVNDALGYKKKAIVITSYPLTLVAEKMNSDDKKEDKKDDEKKMDMSKVKCYNFKKEGQFAKDCKKVKVKDYNYFKTKMLLGKKDNDKQVLLANDQFLSESDEISSSAEETISEVAYYTFQSESESEFETSQYYSNSTNYGLFVNNDDDQENFQDAVESASEYFIENYIDSQKDYDKSEVDHNDYEEKEHLVDKLIQ